MCLVPCTFACHRYCCHDCIICPHDLMICRIVRLISWYELVKRITVYSYNFLVADEKCEMERRNGSKEREITTVNLLIENLEGFEASLLNVSWEGSQVFWGQSIWHPSRTTEYIQKSQIQLHGDRVEFCKQADKFRNAFLYWKQSVTLKKSDSRTSKEAIVASDLRNCVSFIHCH